MAKNGYNKKISIAKTVTIRYTNMAKNGYNKT